MGPFCCSLKFMKFKSLLCLPGYTKKLFIDESSTKSVLLQVLAGAIEVCLAKLGQKICFKVFSKVQLLKITSLLNLKKLLVQKLGRKCCLKGVYKNVLNLKHFTLPCAMEHLGMVVDCLVFRLLIITFKF